MRFRRILVGFSAALLLGLPALGQEAAARPVEARAAVPASPLAAATPSADTRTSEYLPLTPARILDTRSSGHTVDGAFQAVGTVDTGRTVDLTVIGRGGVPDHDVAAVVVNITVTEAAGPGFITAAPTGSPRPLASTLNYTTGATVPNQAIAKVGTGGKITLFASMRTELVVDVVGWVPEGSTLDTLVPARLLDTRPSGLTIDGQSQAGGRVSPAGVVDLVVTGRGGVPASGVDSVVLNVTVTEAAAPGFVTVWPAGSPRPLASTLNYVAGSTVANNAIAKVGAGGKVSFFASADTQLVVDVVGWVASGAGITSVEPARLLDTRASGDTIDGQFHGLGVASPGHDVDLVVTGRGGVPADGAGAVVLNVTVTEAAGPGFVTVWPTGTDRPLASTLNYVAGSTVANGTIAKVGSGGHVSLFVSNNTHLVVDVVGWIVVPINGIDPMVHVLNPDSTLVKGDLDANVAVILPPGEQTRPGEILVTSVADRAFYGRVTDTNGPAALATAVSLGDVIPELDVAIQGDPDQGQVSAVSTARAAEPLAVQLDPATVAAYQAASQHSRIGTSCESNLTSDGNKPVTYDADAGLDFVFESSWGWRGVDRLKVGIRPHLSYSASIDVGGQVDCALNVGLFSRNLPTLRFSIGPVPVVITMQLDVKAYAKVTASAGIRATVGASASTELGVLYEHGQFSRYASPSFNPIVNTSGAFWGTADIEAGIPVRVDAKAYGVLGFYGEAGPYAKLHLDPTKPANQDWATLEGGIRVAAGLTAGVKVGPIKWEKDFQAGSWYPFQSGNIWHSNAGRPSPQQPPQEQPPQQQPPQQQPPQQQPPQQQPPNPTPAVNVSKGGSAQGRPGCSSVYCAMVNVSLTGFAPNSTVTVVCADSTPPAGEFYRYNVRTDGAGNNFSSVCYYGYPGQVVWAVANGVRSPDVRW